jgi:hypothetical protein
MKKIFIFVLVVFCFLKSDILLSGDREKIYYENPGYIKGYKIVKMEEITYLGQTFFMSIPKKKYQWQVLIEKYEKKFNKDIYNNEINNTIKYLNKKKIKQPFSRHKNKNGN